MMKTLGGARVEAAAMIKSLKQLSAMPMHRSAMTHRSPWSSAMARGRRQAPFDFDLGCTFSCIYERRVKCEASPSHRAEGWRQTLLGLSLPCSKQVWKKDNFERTET